MAQLGTQKGTVPQKRFLENLDTLHQATQGYLQDTGTVHCAKVVCQMIFLQNIFLTQDIEPLQL
jgi:hypothetical protein